MDPRDQEIPRPRRAMTRSSEAAVTVGHGKRQDASFASPAGRASRDGTEGIRRDHTPPVGNHGSHFACPGGFLDDKEVYIRPRPGPVNLERNKIIYSEQHRRYPPAGRNFPHRHRSRENITSDSSQNEFHEVRSRLRSVREVSGNVEEYDEQSADETRQSGGAIGVLEQMIDDALEQQSALREGKGFAMTTSSRIGADPDEHGALSAASYSPNRDPTGRHGSRRASSTWLASHEARKYKASPAKTVEESIEPKQHPNTLIYLHGSDLERSNDESVFTMSTQRTSEDTQHKSPDLKANSRSVRQKTADFENISKVTASHSNAESHKEVRDMNAQSSSSGPMKRTHNKPKPPENEDYFERLGHEGFQHDLTEIGQSEGTRFGASEAPRQTLADNRRQRDRKMSASHQSPSKDFRDALGSASLRPSVEPPDVIVKPISQTTTVHTDPPSSRRPSAKLRDTSGLWTRKEGWTLQGKSSSSPPAEIKQNVYAAGKHDTGNIVERGEAVTERDSAPNENIRADTKYAANLSRNAGIENKTEEDSPALTRPRGTSARGAETYTSSGGVEPMVSQQQKKADRRMSSSSRDGMEVVVTKDIPDLSNERFRSVAHDQSGQDQTDRPRYRLSWSRDHDSAKTTRSATDRWTEPGGKASDRQDLEATKKTVSPGDGRSGDGLSNVRERARQIDHSLHSGATHSAASPLQSQEKAISFLGDRTPNPPFSKVISRSHETPSHANNQDHSQIITEIIDRPRQEHEGLLPSSLLHSDALLATSLRDNEGKSEQSVKDGNTSLQVNLSAAGSPPSTPAQHVALGKKKTSAPATPVRGRMERSSPIASPALVARRRQSLSRIDNLRAERDESTERRWDGVSVHVEVHTSPERAGVTRRCEREEWAGENVITVNASVTPGRERRSNN